MSFEYGITKLILKLGPLTSIAILIALFYFLIRHRNFYLSDEGKKGIEREKNRLKTGIAFGGFAFLLFIGCESFEALEMFGLLPEYLHEVHHLSEIPQVIFMILAQVFVLSTAMTVSKGIDSNGP
jgi:hypothetical protein